MTYRGTALANLHEGNLLFGSVTAELVAFGPGEDAEKGRVAIRDPMTEGKPAEEDGESRQETIEGVEGPDSADADEAKQGTLYAPVGERAYGGF